MKWSKVWWLVLQWGWSGLGVEVGSSYIGGVVGLDLGYRNGSQNIGPTIVVIIRKSIDHSIVLSGGDSTSPPNPTGIGGAIGNHQISPPRDRAVLASVAVLSVLDGYRDVVPVVFVTTAELPSFMVSSFHSWS